MSQAHFFNHMRNSRVGRITCAFLALNLITEICAPTMALALTSGPAQPEFSSFEPVATTDMVSDFTGDFTYNLPVLNIPGPDGGGYAMSLSYHSGVSSEEEASWVGFGWTLNPGAINRSKRGYADEFNGVTVEQFNKTRPNWSQHARFDFNMEFDSDDKEPSDKSDDDKTKTINKFAKKWIMGIPKKGVEEPEVSISLAHTIRYNNYSGFSIATGAGISVKQLGSLSLNHSGAQNTLGFSVDALGIFKSISALVKKHRAQNQQQNQADPENNKPAAILSAAEQAKKARREKIKNRARNIGNRLRDWAIGAFGSNYCNSSRNTPSLPYSIAKHEAVAWNFSGSVQFNPAQTGIGLQLGIAGGMNMQVMEGLNDVAAYGYMFSDVTNNNTGADKVFDFQIEKESTFNKHDKYLGIPYNNADVFSASGNGVTGGFRMQHSQIGSFYPNFGTTTTKIRQMGVELGIGSTVQIGLDVGVGKQKTEVAGKWPKMPNMSGKEFSGNDPIMRFTNDPGGESSYGNDYDDLIFGTIQRNKQLDLGGEYNLELDTNKNQRSSYIRYYKDVTTDPSNTSITGIEITNKEGNKSSYMQPVYTRNEAELTIGLSKFNDGADNVYDEMAYIDPMINSGTVVGSKTAAKYAASYLLSNTSTYNYVDADAIPGPSDGDFGGWTKFGYRQAYGSSDWYRYRSPYTGLKYNCGRQIDPTDGTGGMSSGEKEVYYLKCIETKSHIAFFVTNKGTAATFTANFPQADYPFLYEAGQPVSTVTSNIAGSGATRYDGIDAAAIDMGTGKDPAAESPTAKGTHDLERLEKIVLFAKSDLSKPINSTYFEYDYSLCKGIPNSLGPVQSANVNDQGKLTLKKVWSESNGVLKSQIAPYQFFYEYFNNYSAGIVSKYAWAGDYNLKPVNDANQNPFYRSDMLDAWGNYQENGDVRNTNMQSWVSQKDPSATFDPAAWQLKRIVLPSGGEIHVQYEQKEYSSVQDQTPMAMVSLLSDENKDEYTSDESVFCINAEDIETDGNIAEYKARLENHFLTQKNKLYFKILYAYIDDGEPALNTEEIRYDYITGYTNVNDVTLSGGGKILLHLGDTREVLDDVLGEGKKDKTLPRWVCYQELATNGGRNLGPNASAYKNREYLSEAYSGNSTADLQEIKQMARSDVFGNTFAMFKDWLSFQAKNMPKRKACKKINFGLSYFKLPVYHAKKGGGLRVKRLLTYDPGIAGESGDAMIYGSEYSYVNENGSSSGVAVNEPLAMREENALVGFMERKKQKFIDKILNGRDTKQFEGPLGENLLPGAAVVHARIVTKNIHSGKTGTGYQVNQYHTIKDFPMQVEYSEISKNKLPLQGNNSTYKKFNLIIPLAGRFTMSIHRAWVTQGYLFKTNDMNGKIASQATYPGDYDPQNFDASAATSKTSYHYSAPGERVMSLLYDRNSGQIKRDYLNPGTEEDYTMFTSNVREKANDYSLEMDFDLIWPIFPSITMKHSYSYSDILFCQHITSRVVSQASHLLSTTTENDGVVQTTRNLAFDRYTNDPLLTVTFDGYQSPGERVYTEAGGANKHNGVYYSLNIPAYWMYGMMGPKSKSPGSSNQLSAMAGNVVTYSSSTAYDALIASSAWSPISAPLEHVVSASATTFTNNWFTASMATAYPALATSSILAQANQFFYPIQTYAYRDAVSDANASGGKIYQGGTVSNSFKFFNWLNPASPPSEWYSASRATQYSPYGYPVEEEDVLAIKSSAHFGYSDMLPVLVANNAGRNETKFTDFEYGFGGNVYVLKTTAHSGSASYKLSADPNYVLASTYPVNTSRGLSIKLWLNSSLSSIPNSNSYGLKNNNPQLKALIGGKTFDFNAIAQTGEWTLYSAEIGNFKGLSSGAYNIQLSYNYVLPNETVFIDDVRIQPLDASMNCSVYYPDNKLAAQFDDQHFGVFYEYNHKGQLVRKSVETERGRKTLQAQQYNTPLIPR
jgi:hypothetical protein